MTEQGGSGTRRPRGTGSLFTRNGAYYGQWWAGGRQVKRRLARCARRGRATA